MYRIRNWDKHFESNESRKLKTLEWVRIPNKQDSLAYRTIATRKDGAAIFAAWVLMLQVASKQSPRGNLPLSPDELGIVTGFPADIFRNAIEVLKTTKIAWIEQNPDAPGEFPDVSGEGGTPLKKRGEEIRGEENTPHTPPLGGLNGVIAEADKTAMGRFEEARQAYPGSKRGPETEWKNFRKKWGKECGEILPLLLPAIQNGKKHRDWLEKNKAFIPNWKNFQTWINKRSWEEEFAKEVYV